MKSSSRRTIQRQWRGRRHLSGCSLQAERVEIDTIENMDTYDLVPEAEPLELGEPILNSKMAYDVKTDEANNLVKWKGKRGCCWTASAAGDQL